MGPTDAVRSVLTHYATFTGRARRAEYWWFTLFNVLLSIVLSALDRGLGTSIPSYLVTLALLVPGLAVGVRRLHDTSRSGWWLLLGLIPVVGTIILIVWLAGDSRPETNQFGPSPKPLLSDPSWPQQSFPSGPPYQG